eukprot:TRINITY_DN5081_c0_g1_i1.p1 TRINITY_DN5081_c0_g1~~TRINITY_DN5081_c0_g1_i1.p1  ORF type:complete len:130 (-),score=19.01 TRINITY_DN5081_c0_g1_i1:359-691(-)
MNRNLLLWFLVVAFLLLGNISCGKFTKECEKIQKETECLEEKGCKFSCEEDNGAMSHSCSCAQGQDSKAKTSSSARASSKGASASASAHTSSSSSSSSSKKQRAERTAEF